MASLSPSASHEHQPFLLLKSTVPSSRLSPLHCEGPSLNSGDGGTFSITDTLSAFSFPSWPWPHSALYVTLSRVPRRLQRRACSGQLSLVIESPPIVAPEGTLHLLLIWAKCRSVPDSRCCCPWLGILGHRAQRQTPVTGSQSLHSLDPPCFPTLSSSIPQLVLPSP